MWLIFHSTPAATLVIATVYHPFLNALIHDDRDCWPSAPLKIRSFTHHNLRRIITIDKLLELEYPLGNIYTAEQRLVQLLPSD